MLVMAGIDLSRYAIAVQKGTPILSEITDENIPKERRFFLHVTEDGSGLEGRGE